MIRRLHFSVQRRFKLVVLCLLFFTFAMHFALDIFSFSTTVSCPCPSQNHLITKTHLVQQMPIVRTLQDFSGSNGTSVDGSQMLKTLKISLNVHKKATRYQGSKLVSLFLNPLYNTLMPTIKEEDKLFRVNTEEKFTLKSSGSDEW